MPNLVATPHGYRLSHPLPPHVREELRARGLAEPSWDLEQHEWTFGSGASGIAAAAYLVETRRVEVDAQTREDLVARGANVGLPSAAERAEALAAKLRPYQRKGVDYMLDRQRVLLADSMGLGKSLQALVAVEQANAYPSVVVCPSAVKLGWQREVLKWTPWRSVQVIDKGRDKLRGCDLTVLNPELLGRHVEDLKDLRPRAVVLDEAHFFKNPASQRSRLAMELADGVPLRLALTGTPIKNRREDLVHQLRLLDQLEEVLHIYRGILPHWYRRDMGPLAEAHAVRALQALDRRTLNARLREVCMIRRTKEDVAQDLPPLERTRIDVAPPRSTTYRDEEKALMAWVKDWQKKGGAGLDLAAGHGLGLQFRQHLTRLRREAALAKIPAAREWAETLHGGGERVIFFAYHKNVVDQLAKALPGRSAKITGDTPHATRRNLLDALDHFDFLVATMDSTGYGVDGIQLHASHVAFIELDWTPTKHEQCEGRLHRIGQTDHVNAWYFVATNTIDQDMMNILESKWADIQGVVEGRTDDEEFLGEMLRRILEHNH